MNGSPRPLRLPYLDGVRGLAALYVVGYHAFCTADCSLLGWRHTLPPLVEKGFRWLLHGHLAVDLFIVLSGFCLMLPIATHPRRELAGGFWPYLARRARRILPPYFAALAVTLVCIALIPALGQPAGVYWDSALPAFRPDVLLSHVFLVHNLDPDLASKINYPHWSVATEWQIYFFLPLLLLPLWRRAGLLVAVATTVAVSVLPHFLIPERADRACLHFLGLFALGAGAAVLATSEEPWTRRARWGLLAALTGIPLLLGMQFRHHLFELHQFAMDFPIGIAAALLLIYGARCARRDGAPANPLIRFLEWRPVVWLGAISYSVYLIHAPVLAALHVVTRSGGLSSLATLGLMLTLGVLLAVLVGWGFHLALEKPFLARRSPRLPSTAWPAAAAGDAVLPR